MSAAGFDAGALSRRLSVLDAVPASLQAAVIVHPLGSLWDRCAGVASLRSALLEGKLPDDLSWPEEPWQRSIVEALGRLNLPHYCRGHEALTDAVLQSVLDLSADALGRLASEAAEVFRQLMAHERARRAREDESRRKARKGAGEAAESEAAAEEARLRVKALELARGRGVEALGEALDARWWQHVEAWASLEEVFGTLGAMLDIGWDLRRGVLRTRGWLEVVELHRWIARLPTLRSLASLLGRLREPMEGRGHPILEEVVEAMSRASHRPAREMSPRVPIETRGIELHNEVLRMLPAEAVLLRRPRLRTVWRAKWAERRLLCWYREGELAREVAATESVDVRTKRERAGSKLGPMVVLLDTSGSMQGLPERVAKALTLEVARIAHKEQRACHLIAFSGPGDTVTHDLALTEAGLSNLMAFLAASFHGGTDLATPVARMAERLAQPAWHHADVLTVTDGGFALGPETAARIQQARALHGTRFHAVFVGGTCPAFAALCDKAHHFTQWSSFDALPP